jgi:glyoxylase-like metal-dependent hydrolase (beta-lactamase superfamily II)
MEHTTRQERATRLDRIADGLYAWLPDGQGTWGLANCGLLVGDGAALLIDTPYDLPRTERLLAACAEVLPPGTSIGTVVTTHANGDHSYGLPALPGAEIIATEEFLIGMEHEPSPAQMHLLTTALPEEQPLGWYARRHFGRFSYAGLERVAPTRTFRGELELTVGGVPVRLVQAGPAHTDGDLWVHLPRQGVVFTGDLVFAGDHPVHWAGPLARVVAGLEAMLATGAEVFVPGHGPVQDPAGIRAHLAYLEELRGYAAERHAAGVGAEEAARQLIAAERWPGLGLPERLAISLATEYRHLDGDQGSPDLVGLVTGAARIALERAGLGIPAQRAVPDDASPRAEDGEHPAVR